MSPLSRSQFEAGDEDPALAALDFLKANPDLAFTVEELAEAVADIGTRVDAPVLRRSLGRLKARGAIEARSIKRVIYYRYRRRDMGFRR